MVGNAPPARPVHPSWTAVLTDPVRLAVLRGLLDLTSATAARLAARCHTSESTVRRHLEALEALGLVREQPGESDGLTPGRPASRFTLDCDAAVRVSALFELISEPLVAAPQPPGLLRPLHR